MASSQAATVDEYLQELPPERREVISAVREVVLQNLPNGYVEGMNWGMISYEIPLETYPNTYNGKPLSYIALAAQKRHYALYLSGVYQNPDQQALLEKGFELKGKRLDMGKSCVRFRKLDDLPLDVVGQVVAATSTAELIAGYEAYHPK